MRSSTLRMRGTGDAHVKTLTGRNGLPTHARATQAQRYRPPVTSPPPPPRHTHSPEVGGEEEAKPKAAWIGAPQSLVRDTTPLSERTEQEPRNARGRKRAFHPPSRVGLQRSCRRGTREEEGPALGWRAHNAIVSANKTHPHAYTRAGHTISRAREGEEATLSTRLGDGDSTQSQKKKQASAVFWRRLDSWTTNGIELESSTDMRIPQKNHAG